MKNIIEALKIFLEHEDKGFPFGCGHDALYVYYDPDEFSKTELEKLGDLGFHADFVSGYFYKFV